MTINQLLETVMGKACAIKGEYGDATPFGENGDDKAKKICDELGKLGYEKHGWEVMYNGFTGEEIKAKIMFGVTYYQRLKHMVHDKMHSRGRGNVTTLHRQPLVRKIFTLTFLRVFSFFVNEFLTNFCFAFSTPQEGRSRDGPYRPYSIVKMFVLSNLKNEIKKFAPKKINGNRKFSTDCMERCIRIRKYV